MGMYSIENFIWDNHSICREERQYALFLYNILRKYSSMEIRRNLKDEEKEKIEHIFFICQLEHADVEQVFYEASFMRDFFKQSQKEKKVNFNNELIRYIYKEYVKCENNIEYSDEGKNLGHNQINREKLLQTIDDEQFDKLNFAARCMMNAKPDIAVLYKQNGKRYFLFLECKFETGEKSYTDKRTSTKLSLSQRKVQWMIADFLCKNVFKSGKEIKLAEYMVKNEESCLIQFGREEAKGNNIKIETLIKLNNDIFDKDDCSEK